MELGTTIFGIVLFALCCLPIVLSATKRNKKNRQTLAKLTAFAAQHHCTVEEHELAFRFSIGIDKHKQHFFFCSEWQQEAINLSA
ncbi:MAG: hypothetical protein ACK5LR_09895, partial [Mangrovibacterium sp.]